MRANKQKIARMACSYSNLFSGSLFNLNASLPFHLKNEMS